MSVETLLVIELEVGHNVLELHQDGSTDGRSSRGDFLSDFQDFVSR